MMYTIYNELKEIAEKEFEDIVNATNFIGGKASAPNKLRIYLKESELDEDNEEAIRDVLGFIQRKLAEYGIKITTEE